MPFERNLRRLPLRDLLTDAEKRNRDLIEHLHNTWLARAADLRDLSRPVRRRSHYPTLVPRTIDTPSGELRTLNSRRLLTRLMLLI